MSVPQDLRERLARKVSLCWDDQTSSETVDMILTELDAAGYAVVPKRLTKLMVSAAAEARGRPLQEFWKDMLAATKGETDASG